MTEPTPEVATLAMGSETICFCHGGYPKGFEGFPGASDEVRPATQRWTWIRDAPFDRVRTTMVLCDECAGVWSARYAAGDHPPDASYSLEPL